MKNSIRAGNLVTLNEFYKFDMVRAWGVGLVLRTYTDRNYKKRATVKWFGTEFVVNPGEPENEMVSSLKVISK